MLASRCAGYQQCRSQTRDAIDQSVFQRSWILVRVKKTHQNKK